MIAWIIVMKLREFRCSAMMRFASISSARGDVNAAERGYPALSSPPYTARGRCAFAGYVGDEHAQAVIVERQQIK